MAEGDFIPGVNTGQIMGDATTGILGLGGLLVVAVLLFGFMKWRSFTNDALIETGGKPYFNRMKYSKDAHGKDCYELRGNFFENILGRTAKFTQSINVKPGDTAHLIELVPGEKYVFDARYYVKTGSGGEVDELEVKGKQDQLNELADDYYATSLMLSAERWKSPIDTLLALAPYIALIVAFMFWFMGVQENSKAHVEASANNAAAWTSQERIMQFWNNGSACRVYCNGTKPAEWVVNQLGGNTPPG